MTLIVGILCRDGVVMASDSAATMGASGFHTIGQQWVKKLALLDPRTLMAATGAIGIGQLIGDRVKRMSQGGALGGGKTPEQIMHDIGIAIGEMVRPYFDLAQVQKGITGDAAGTLCKSMIALPVKKEPCLFTFDFNGAPERVTKELPFVAMGSGQVIADPFLAFLKRTFWASGQPTVADGRLVAVWAIEHVCQTNPGGVGGTVQLATLVNEQASISDSDEIEAHRERVADAERAMVRAVREEAAPKAEVPAPPAAPTALATASAPPSPTAA